MKFFIILYLILSFHFPLHGRAATIFFKYPESQRMLCSPRMYNGTLEIFPQNIRFKEIVPHQLEQLPAHIKMDLTTPGWTKNHLQKLSNYPIESLDIIALPNLLEQHSSMLKKIVRTVKHLKIQLPPHNHKSYRRSLPFTSKQFKALMEIIAAGANVSILSLAGLEIYLDPTQEHRHSLPEKECLERMNLLLNTLLSMNHLENLNLSNMGVGWHFKTADHVVPLLQNFLRKSLQLQHILVWEEKQHTIYVTPNNERWSILPKLLLAAEEGIAQNPSKPFVHIEGWPYYGKLCKA